MRGAKGPVARPSAKARASQQPGPPQAEAPKSECKLKPKVNREVRERMRASRQGLRVLEGMEIICGKKTKTLFFGQIGRV